MNDIVGHPFTLGCVGLFGQFEFIRFHQLLLVAEVIDFGALPEAGHKLALRETVTFNYHLVLLHTDRLAIIIQVVCSTASCMMMWGCVQHILWVAKYPCICILLVGIKEGSCGSIRCIVSVDGYERIEGFRKAWIFHAFRICRQLLLEIERYLLIGQTSQDIGELLLNADLNLINETSKEVVLLIGLQRAVGLFQVRSTITSGTCQATNQESAPRLHHVLSELTQVNARNLRSTK
mmetsp:Transcript_6112/g.6993  ORF Transcript_6112/g.6993 Transcript_6112/m.6993 type:complete len:235 (+) Transcript_6112:4267-4971(+)